MEIKNEMDVGLFARKIYTGHLFAKKTYEEFYLETRAKNPKLTDEEVEEKADKDFMNYLESEKPKEWVFMREPTTPEAKSLSNQNDVDEKILDKLDVEARIVREENRLKLSAEKESEIVDLVSKCIVSSSFTIEGKEAPIEKVREIYLASTRAMNYLAGQWMDSQVNFQQKSVKK